MPLERPNILLFANPIAGQGKAKALALEIARRVELAGFTVQTHFQPADKIDRRVFDAPALAAISIGGDGTLRTVARRLLREAGSRQRPVTPIVVVPMGTANLMAQHLRLQWPVGGAGEAIVEMLRLGRVVEIDAAQANGELMLLVAGVGIDGSVVHEMDKVRSGPISYLSYAIPALRALANYRYPALRVSVDGQRVFRSAPAMAFIGNIQEYGTGFPILPKAIPNDGLLDVCVLPCATPMELAEHLLHAADGSHLHSAGVVYVTGHHVRVESDEPVPVQIDGEAGGHTPLQVDLMQGKVRFFVQGAGLDAPSRLGG